MHRSMTQEGGSPGTYYFLPKARKKQDDTAVKHLYPKNRDNMQVGLLASSYEEGNKYDIPPPPLCPRSHCLVEKAVVHSRGKNKTASIANNVC